MNRYRLLKSVYDEQASSFLDQEISKLVRRYQSMIKTEKYEPLTNQDTLLITYGDSILSEKMSPLSALKVFLEKFGYSFSHVHILPFYPFSSDDGFSVIDYKQVSTQFGDWEDINALSSAKKLMFDGVINHISAKSDWVADHLANIPDKTNMVFEDDALKDWSQVVRPRTSPLFHDFEDDMGTKRELWTTFSQDQVDLDYRNPKLLLAIVEVLFFYVFKGANIIRLDAIGFMWKEPGTTCIHLPQTHALVQLFRMTLAELAPSVKLVTETNVPHVENISYFGDGDNEAHMVYNFTLPPLLAYSLLSQSAQKFYEWASTLSLPSSTACFFNFLSSHDGVGVRPVQGILSDNEVQLLIDAATKNGGQVSYKANSEGGKDPYEINCNYFSLLRGKEADQHLAEKRMILAHAVLLAFPGFPAIYIHSLLGSQNDTEGMKKAGYLRAINREKLNLDTLEFELQDGSLSRESIFDSINQLIQVKKKVPAFDPYASFRFALVNDHVISLTRGAGEAVCYFNFSEKRQELLIANAFSDLVNDRSLAKGEKVTLKEYDFLWLG